MTCQRNIEIQLLKVVAPLQLFLSLKHKLVTFRHIFLPNVISITDGQIFLEGNLFNSGVRPAINVGISVSRVGGNAQIKSMKKVAGTLKLDQAQYKNLEAFAKFGSDLDAATMAILDKGAKNVELLKQGLHSPLTVEKQVAIMYCGTNGLLKEIPLSKVKEFEVEFLQHVEMKNPEVLSKLRDGIINEDISKAIEKLAAEVVEKLKS